jgi:hypothetical protein
MPPESLTVAVDRIEKGTVVFESDDGRRFEVPAKSIHDRPSEGTIYRVAVDAAGNPLWATAQADPEETARRRMDLSRRMKARRDRDDGGDIEL